MCCYIKIIVSYEKEKELLPLMKAWPEAESYRFAVRAQAGAPGICAIYIYDAEATVKAAEAVLLKQLLEEDPAMKAFHVYSENGYHTEHDALRVLSRIERKYEPFSFLPTESRRINEKKTVDTQYMRGPCSHSHLCLRSDKRRGIFTACRRGAPYSAQTAWFQKFTI